MNESRNQEKKYYNRDKIGVIISSGELFGKDIMPKDYRNVAIYARVSTEHEAQISALSNQVQYYDDILSKHPNWNLIDRYIDEGITGTSVNKRPNFLRMMEDAKEGNFDLIITREVARFARNTVDTLQETRKLKKIGVEVWFTEDNIWTLNDEDGELRLSIMATLAQNESKKTSLRVKAGQKVSMENGVPYGNGNILGYKKNKTTGNMDIDEEQAEVVRFIFDKYLEGMGVTQIKYELEKREIKTATGLTQWNASVISRMLKNPFYCGTIVYRKEFVPDYLEQKKVKNCGEVEQIIVEGKHAAIVTKEEFEQVQKMLEKKRVYQTPKTESGKRAKAPATDIWVKKGRCKCGHRLYRRNYGNRTGRERQYSYQCYDTFRNGSKKTRENKGLSVNDTCVMPMVARWKLDAMALVVFENIFFNKKEVLQMAQDILMNYAFEKEDVLVEQEIKEAKDMLNKNRFRKENLIDLYMDGLISKDEYVKREVQQTKLIEELEKRLEVLEQSKKLQGIDVEKRMKTLLSNIEEKAKFDVEHIPDCVLDEFVDRIIFCEDGFEWYLNVCDEDFKVNLKNANKNARKKDIHWVSPIIKDDVWAEKKYIHAGTFTVKREDVNRVIANRNEYKKGNRFKEFKVKVFI